VEYSALSRHFTRGHGRALHPAEWCLCSRAVGKKATLTARNKPAQSSLFVNRQPIKVDY
jgi:hypothetical protein